MKYLESIIWLSAWPILVFASYKLIKFAIKFLNKSILKEEIDS